MKKIIPILFSFAALTGVSQGATLAQYTFLAANVTNSAAAGATASNVAPAATGLSVSTMTVATGSSGYSISGTTETAYGSSSVTPTLGAIYSSTRYHTFTLTLTDPYTLQSLAFEMGGFNTSGSTVEFSYGAQVRIGAGSFTDLATSSASLATGTVGNYAKTGDYSVNLGGTFANLDDTTVTFRIFLADDSTSSNSTNRIKNVVVNGVAVPEPSALMLGALGFLALLRRKR